MKLFTLLISTFLFLSNLAAERLPEDNTHKGIIVLKDDISIFPQNRLNNTLYQNDEFLFTKSNHTVISAKAVFGSFLVHLKKENGRESLLLISGENAEIQKVGTYYKVSSKKDFSRKIFRLYNHKIQDLLTNSKTASGLKVNNKNVGVFYHITKRKNIEDKEGKKSSTYHFKLHLIKPTIKTQINLRGTIVNKRPSLKLNWINNTSFTYTLSDNTVKTVTIPK